MKILTDDLSTIRDADYDPETDMLQLTIVCRPYEEGAFTNLTWDDEARP